MLETRELPEVNGEYRLHLAGAPDYRFLKCLECGPLGENWSIRTAQGKDRLAQFLPAGDQEAAIQRLLHIHSHPALVRFDVARRHNDQPFLVTKAYRKNLRDRLEECWRQGKPGIPRAELLPYLRQVADVFEDLYVKFQVQHLALCPKNLIIADDRLLIAGFGWVELFWVPTQQCHAALNPRYAAPELYYNRIHAASDQYSLALLYTELATGVHPLRAYRDNSAADARLDLTMLSQEERQVIERALSPNPADRFGSLPSMIRALEAAGVAQEPRKQQDLPVITCLSGELSTSSGLLPASMDAYLSDLVSRAAGAASIREFNKIRYRIEPGQQISHRFAVQTFPGAVLIKLGGFRQDWKAELVHQEPGLLSLAVHMPVSFWASLKGRRLGLEIKIRLSAPSGARRTEVGVVIRPFGCEVEQAVRLLDDIAPQMLESLRNYLLAQPEQRTNERLLCSRPLRICPVVGGVEVADAIDCVSKDISANGIGFYLPRPVTASQVYVNMPDVPELASLAGLARVVRRQACGDGWYEIGALFTHKTGRS